MFDISNTQKKAVLILCCFKNPNQKLLKKSKNHTGVECSLIINYHWHLAGGSLFWIFQIPKNAVFWLKHPKPGLNKNSKNRLHTGVVYSLLVTYHWHLPPIRTWRAANFGGRGYDDVDFEQTSKHSSHTDKTSIEVHKPRQKVFDRGARWMSALINYDGGENNLRTNIPTRFLPCLVLVCIVSYATQSEQQPLPAASIKVSILQYHHQRHHPQNALGYITNPPLSQRSEPSTIFHTSRCMLPARLLESFDSDNQFSRRKSLSIHIGRTL